MERFGKLGGKTGNAGIFSTEGENDRAGKRIKGERMIGENGCELSGGERQRISIARAFRKNSPVILLDEATANPNVENETLIQAALSRMIKDKTVLVIAHRMCTVSGADKVVVLSDGSVAEQGTPEELMDTGRIYPHMVKLQMISRDWGI